MYRKAVIHGANGMVNVPHPTFAVQRFGISFMPPQRFARLTTAILRQPTPAVTETSTVYIDQPFERTRKRLVTTTARYKQEKPQVVDSANVALVVSARIAVKESRDMYDWASFLQFLSSHPGGPHGFFSTYHDLFDVLIGGAGEEGIQYTGTLASHSSHSDLVSQAKLELIRFRDDYTSLFKRYFFIPAFNFLFGEALSDDFLAILFKQYYEITLRTKDESAFPSFDQFSALASRRPTLSFIPTSENCPNFIALEPFLSSRDFQVIVRSSQFQWLFEGHFISFLLRGDLPGTLAMLNIARQLECQRIPPPGTRSVAAVVARRPLLFSAPFLRRLLPPNPAEQYPSRSNAYIHHPDDEKVDKGVDKKGTAIGLVQENANEGNLSEVQSSSCVVEKEIDNNSLFEHIRHLLVISNPDSLVDLMYLLSHVGQRWDYPLPWGLWCLPDDVERDIFLHNTTFRQKLLFLKTVLHLVLQPTKTNWRLPLSTLLSAVVDSYLVHFRAQSTRVTATASQEAPLEAHGTDEEPKSNIQTLTTEMTDLGELSYVLWHLASIPSSWLPDFVHVTLLVFPMKSTAFWVPLCLDDFDQNSAGRRARRGRKEADGASSHPSDVVRHKVSALRSELVLAASRALESATPTTQLTSTSLASLPLLVGGLGGLNTAPSRTPGLPELIAHIHPIINNNNNISTNTIERTEPRYIDQTLRKGMKSNVEQSWGDVSWSIFDALHLIQGLCQLRCAEADALKSVRHGDRRFSDARAGGSCNVLLVDMIECLLAPESMSQRFHWWLSQFDQGTTETSMSSKPSLASTSWLPPVDERKEFLLLICNILHWSYGIANDQVLTTFKTKFLASKRVTFLLAATFPDMPSLGTYLSRLSFSAPHLPAFLCASFDVTPWDVLFQQSQPRSAVSLMQLLQRAAISPPLNIFDPTQETKEILQSSFHQLYKAVFDLPLGDFHEQFLGQLSVGVLRSFLNVLYHSGGTESFDKKYLENVPQHIIHRWSREFTNKAYVSQFQLSAILSEILRTDDCFKFQAEGGQFLGFHFYPLLGMPQILYLIDAAILQQTKSFSNVEKKDDIFGDEKLRVFSELGSIVSHIQKLKMKLPPLFVRYWLYNEDERQLLGASTPDGGERFSPDSRDDDGGKRQDHAPPSDKSLGVHPRECWFNLACRLGTLETLSSFLAYIALHSLPLSKPQLAMLFEPPPNDPTGKTLSDAVSPFSTLSKMYTRQLYYTQYLPLQGGAEGGQETNPSQSHQRPNHRRPLDELFSKDPSLRKEITRGEGSNCRSSTSKPRVFQPSLWRRSGPEGN